jgi:predicted Zn-dependent protease
MLGFYPLAAEGGLVLIMNATKRLFIIFFVLSLIIDISFPSGLRGADNTDIEENRRIGNLLDIYITASFVILKNDDLAEKVSRITGKILSSTDNAGNEIRVRIINDSLPVASSFPGYLYVSTGMLDMLENEDELASVIAHAIAHINEKAQYHAYKTAEKMDKIATITGQLIPLLAFTGLAGAGMAGASLTQSIVNPILTLVSGTYGSTAIYTKSLSGLPDKKSTINRLGPYLYLPDTKLNLTALVFFEEIYGGYKKDNEIEADALAINYLYRSGYDPEAFIAILEKLLRSKNDMATNGYLFHLLSSEPGLEKRITNANTVIENLK